MDHDLDQMSAVERALDRPTSSPPPMSELEARGLLRQAGMLWATAFGECGAGRIAPDRYLAAAEARLILADPAALLSDWEAETLQNFVDLLTDIPPEIIPPTRSLTQSVALLVAVELAYPWALERLADCFARRGVDWVANALRWVVSLNTDGHSEANSAFSN